MNAISTMPAIDYDRVRREITERMAAAELSQHGLSEATGGSVDQSGLSKFLRGSTEKLGLEHIEAIATALACSRADLTGETAVPVVAEGEAVVRMIPWNRLIPSPQNPRTDMDPEALDGLMQSIVSRGVLQNLRGRPDGMGSYFIIAGHRRHAAVGLAVERELLPDTYPMPLAVDDVDDAEALTQALIENLHREDMHPLDEAAAYVRLAELNGWEGVQIAEAIGKEARYVQQRIRLTEALGEKATEAFRKHQITFSQARALCGAEEEVQDLCLARATGDGYRWYHTAEDLERGVKVETENKKRRDEAAAAPAPADGLFATPEEKAEAARQVEERNRKAEQENRARQQRRALAEADVKKLNDAVRTSLQLDPKLTARAALHDLFCQSELQMDAHALRSPLSRETDLVSDEGLCHRILQIEPEEDEEAVAWNARLWQRVLEIEDPAERLVSVMAQTAEPAEMGWSANVYTAQISPFGRRLALQLRVAVPASFGAEPTAAAATEEEVASDDVENAAEAEHVDG